MSLLPAFATRCLFLIYCWTCCDEIIAFPLSDGAICKMRIRRQSPASAVSTSLQLATSGPRAETLEIYTEIPALPHLVVLLPAYNEQYRIGDTIEKYQDHLAQSDTWRNSCSILVVDDGSEDDTVALIQAEKVKCMVPLECISLSYNQGKGVAVAFGIQQVARGCSPALVLVADADGSADLERSLVGMLRQMQQTISSHRQQTCIEKQLSFWETPAMVVGSRGYDGTSISRSVLRWGFRTVVRLICGDLRVSDSQCGFKLITLAAAKPLYANLYLKRWSHDVEVLLRAREWNIPVAEASVQWKDKEGSKLVTSSLGAVQVSLQMLWEVFRMRAEYAIGTSQSTRTNRLQHCDSDTM